MRIKSIQKGTNAQLIATAAQLYPLEGAVLDMTPGDELGFWHELMPPGLVLLPAGCDFRDTGANRADWDHIIYDPPYVTKGGHKTSTIDTMNRRYGMLEVEKAPLEQWTKVILPGVAEANRILKKGGLLWWKMQDYVTSGHVFWFTKMAYGEVEKRGFRLVDEFILDGNPGPQPLVNIDGTPRIQRHAAKAHSNLLICKKLRDI